MAFLPVAVLMQVRAQLIVAAVIATMIVAYPALRGANIIPVDTITALTESINPDRAGSFNFRLENEDILLARANQKPLTGWGGWGRSRDLRPAERQGHQHHRWQLDHRHRDIPGGWAISPSSDC